jgi:predicted nucleic-acid-binding Zn-ribbon protein
VSEAEKCPKCGADKLAKSDMFRCGSMWLPGVFDPEAKTLCQRDYCKQAEEMNRLRAEVAHLQPVADAARTWYRIKCQDGEMPEDEWCAVFADATVNLIAALEVRRG